MKKKDGGGGGEEDEKGEQNKKKEKWIEALLRKYRNIREEKQKCMCSWDSKKCIDLV